jgi:hypothetical protein
MPRQCRPTAAKGNARHGSGTRSSRLEGAVLQPSPEVISTFADPVPPSAVTAVAVGSPGRFKVKVKGSLDQRREENGSKGIGGWSPPLPQRWQTARHLWTVARNPSHFGGARLLVRELLTRTSIEAALRATVAAVLPVPSKGDGALPHAQQYASGGPWSSAAMIVSQSAIGSRGAMEKLGSLSTQAGLLG